MNDVDIQHLAGKQYMECASLLSGIDFDGVYPEIDSRGVLTGNVVEAHSQDHVICDVDAAGLLIHQGAGMAMTPEHVDVNTAPCAAGCGDRSRDCYLGSPCCMHGGCRATIAATGFRS